MRKLIVLIAIALSISLCGCTGFFYLNIYFFDMMLMPDEDEAPPLPVLPARASDPYPADGAVNVPVTADLLWSTAALANYYNVYLGTVESSVIDATPGSPEFMGNCIGGACDPGVLNYSTTFIWRVDSVGTDGVTKGDIWSFATEASPTGPPDKVTGPDPANTVVNVPIDKILQWSPARGATSYNVYFGTNPVNVADAVIGSPEFRGTQTEIVHSPGILTYGTNYYWRVDSTNLYGTTKGNLWSFATVPPPPDADFIGSPTEGFAPLIVNFTDNSAGDITSWSWDFGDSNTSTEQNPSHQYMQPNTYTVTLTVTGPGGSDSETKINYITANDPTPAANFTANPTSGPAPLTVVFTDASTGNINSWSWDFGVSASPWAADTQGPHSVTFGTQGSKTISLTVSGPGGTDTKTKYGFITVDPPLTTFYVATTGNDTTGDGRLSKPFATIQRGLDAASGGTTVLVLDGVYMGTANKNLDFQGKDIALKSTGGPDNCIIDCEGSGRGFHFYSGETSDAVVEGFTIRNAAISGPVPTGFGAGFFCELSGPTITNCIITENTGVRGGGIFCDDCNPIISSCIITSNSATQDGGGIYCRGNCSPTVMDCVITDNTADRYGGGIHCTDLADAVLTNCLVAGNHAQTYGGGIYCREVVVILSNCTITSNLAEDSGGGIYSFYLSSPVLNNTILWSNTAVTSGNEIYADAGSPVTLNQCDFASNSLDPNNISGPFSTLGSCISVDPAFVNVAGQDYRIGETSPCIDTGENLLIPLGVIIDLDGNARVSNETVDIGAYEYQWPRNWVLCSSSDNPSPLIRAVMAYDSDRNVVVLFGGWDGGAYRNDTWEWNGSNWTLKSPLPKPGPMMQLAMTYDSARNKVLLFGDKGFMQDNETWEWDGSSWTRGYPVNQPDTDYGLAMAFDAERAEAVLFTSSGSPRVSETWTWNGSNWTLEAPLNSPRPLSGHSMVYDSNRKVVVLFGGYKHEPFGSDGRCADTWEWNGYDWTYRTCATKPAARDWHCMAYDAAVGVTIMFGGVRGVNTYCGDTWAWNGTNWVEHTPADSPAERKEHAMAYDIERGKVVLFGGNADTVLQNDTWEY